VAARERDGRRALVCGASIAAFRASTEPRTYDQYGYPTNWPGGWRILGYVTAAQALFAVPTSILSWSARGRCKQLDAHMRALVAARDCGTVVKLDGEIAAIDANFRDTVLSEDPGVAGCVREAGSGAAQRPDSGVAAMTKTARARAAAGDCATVRMLAKQVMKLSPEYYRSEFESDAALVACEIPVE
jgi:hypothetical protein